MTKKEERATAAELLPDVVGDPAGQSRAAPPTTELRMTCEQPADNGVLPTLDTLVDLTSLGTNGNGTRSRMAVTITSEPAMGRAGRQRLPPEAPVYMAGEFGYVDAGPVGFILRRPTPVLRPGQQVVGVPTGRPRIDLSRT